VNRAVAAIGDRSWRSGAPSAPEPFERLPLRWELAFGGPKHGTNPVGVGLDGKRLPNLEDPDQLICGERDRPSPACFAPRSATWRSRSSKLGSYDADWLAKRWPYFPRDFDWGYFNAAPARQQCEYLRGDERFELGGVRADQPVVDGQLGGLHAQAFAQLSPEAGGGFREIPCQLDTVAFDADALEVALVWRGLLDVSAEHAPEIDRLFVCASEVGRPVQVEAARERFHAAMVALHGAVLLSEDAPAVTELSAADEPSTTEPPRPPLTAGVAPVLSREDALLLVESTEILDGLSFAGCDLREVDLAGRSLRGCHFTDAQLDGARFDGADLSGALLVRANAVGACFRGATLTAANLAEAALGGVDFGEAKLDGASLVDASASGARFDQASLGMAQLTDSRLERSSFDGCAAAHANFSGAALDGATFVGAVLDDAQLYDAKAAGVRFDDASLVRCRADGAQLGGASFVRARASEASFETADLEGAQLVDADLSRAVFSHGNLTSAVLTRATAVGARFRHGRLARVLAAKSNLMEANFESADLSGADLRGANLYGVETWKATLDGAMLDQALTAGSKLAT